MAKLFIVDDDSACLQFLATSLREAGHEVVTCQTGADAIASGGAVCPDVLICDMLLDPTCNGVDVALALRKVLPSLKVIFMTGLPAFATKEKDLQGLTGATILEKPLSLRLLVGSILEQLRSRG